MPESNGRMPTSSEGKQRWPKDITLSKKSFAYREGKSQTFSNMKEFREYSIESFCKGKRKEKNCLTGTFLVAQWLRIRLPMQGTRVWSPVREDPTCRGATGPMRHNCLACALEPATHSCWAHVPQLLEPVLLEPLLGNRRSHHSEKPTHRSSE